MNDPLTKADRAAMRAMCEAATPGEWLWEDWFVHGDGTNAAGDYWLTAPSYTRGKKDEPAWLRDLRNCIVVDEDREIGQEDRDFIAHARTDLPRALDALDAADAEIERLRGLIGGFLKWENECAHTGDEWMEMTETLAGALAP